MWMVRWFLACLVAGWWVSACAQAQGTNVVKPLGLFDLGAPSFTNFTTRDGVPESVIASVQTARDGFVWLASAQGLARYDGQRWHTDEPATVEGSIGYLLVDHDGTLWASFRDRGVAQFEQGAWKFDDAANGLVTRHVRRLTETVDAGGGYELWAPTFDAGLLLHDHDRWIPAPGNEQLPAAVLSVARTRSLGGHARLWAGTFNEGLWFREDGDWQRLRTAQFDPAQIEHLLVSEHDGHEELWISAFGNGLWRLDDSGLRSWNVALGNLPTDELYDIAQSHAPDGDPVIWVASRSGLVRVHDDHVEVFDRRHGLPSNVVRGISIWRSPDGSDVLWLATEGGVSRAVIGADRWQTASLMGSQSIGVFGVLVEPDGSGSERLWVASSADGLGLYEHGQWRHFTQADGSLPDSDVRMIRRATDENGESVLWLGQRNGYLLRVHEGPRFEPVQVPWERHPGEAIMDMLTRQFEGRAERWFATRQSGVYRWRDGAWTAFRPETAVGQWRITRLLEQRDGAGRSWLWAATNQGLARYDNQRWVLIGTDAGMPDLALAGMTLIPDLQGRPVLWIGTANSGLVRVDIGDPSNPRVLPSNLPAPPDLAVYSATPDSTGRIYVCTNAGVQLLTPHDGTYDSQVFSRRNGMVHEECNTNAQFVDAHDRFWTGTLGGLTVFDPAHSNVDVHPKPLVLTQVRVDGNAAGGDGVRVVSGKHEVHVEFALLSWQRETESRFRTQLVGYEPEPGAWTNQNHRNFNSLPPGDYTLRIEGRDYAGNLSGPLDLAVAIVPAWWQRRWAQATFALAAFIALYGLVYWRTRSINAQRQRLQDQVAEHTAELNAANTRLRELSYQDALTGISNRRALLEALDTMGASAAMATLVFVDVDRFKDYNDNFGHPAGDEALQCVARTMLATVPDDVLICRYGGEEFACLLFATDLARAVEIAEQIRAAVEVCDVPIPGTAVINHVTISAGVASRLVASMDDAHQLLRDADNALYYAKNDGRNCVRT
ncbi:MAG TPA: diguanylate cyclase [Rudaea sp.]|jgi:diguanylate cyclase (GGDEF)-like protein